MWSDVLSISLWNATLKLLLASWTLQRGRGALLYPICLWLQSEHNETVRKLDFVLALAERVASIAQSHGSPLSDSFVGSSTSGTSSHLSTERQRRVDQLVLYVHALQLLAASLELARYEIRAGRLHPSAVVRNSQFPLLVAFCTLDWYRNAACFDTLRYARRGRSRESNPRITWMFCMQFTTLFVAGCVAGWLQWLHSYWANCLVWRVLFLSPVFIS